MVAALERHPAARVNRAVVIVGAVGKRRQSRRIGLGNDAIATRAYRQG